MKSPTLVAALLALASPALAEPVVGRASVVDGDTLEIRGTRVRLHAVDAPEGGQTCQDAARKPYRCGQRAALALSDRIGTQVVFCEEKDRDRYGRVVAACRLVGDGENLNAWLVREGLALAYREFGTQYVRQEAEAKAAVRGLWAGTFTPPWEWRRAERGAGPARR